MDKARYLGTEYRYKEKDYGIYWRSAYKEELQAKVQELLKDHENPLAADQVDKRFDFYFDIIYKLVAKDYKDVKTFFDSKQDHLVSMLDDHLD